MAIRITRNTVVAIGVVLAFLTSAQAAESPQEDDDGTIHVPAFTLPESSLLSDETRTVLKRERAEAARGDFASACYSGRDEDSRRWSAIRDCVAEAFHKTDQYRRLRVRYPVTVSAQRTLESTQKSSRQPMGSRQVTRIACSLTCTRVVSRAARGGPVTLNLCRSPPWRRPK